MLYFSQIYNINLFLFNQDFARRILGNSYNYYNIKINTNVNRIMMGEIRIIKPAAKSYHNSIAVD